ncbi:MAG TPA: SRPBCC family protein [Burkholderiales bacterium]|nr:SRPBCC family protein [Burkholderiales bacterium]
MTTNGENELNLMRGDRIAYGIVGTLLLMSGVRNFGLIRSLLGGTLLYQAYTGYNPLFAPLGIRVNPHPVEGKKETIVVSGTVTIAAPREQVYGYWRELENVPHFMRHIESVQVFDARHSHWRARAPGDKIVEWDSEIVEDIPGALLRWRSMPGSGIANFGVVHFLDSPQGTAVYVEYQYVPPGGTLGTAIARLTGKEPQRQTEEALRNLKLLLEGGAVPATAAPLDAGAPGQPVMGSEV